MGEDGQVEALRCTERNDRGPAQGDCAGLFFYPGHSCMISPEKVCMVATTKGAFLKEDATSFDVAKESELP